MKGDSQKRPFRLDRYLTMTTGMTRSQARRCIGSGAVSINDEDGRPKAGSLVGPEDAVFLDGERLILDQGERYFMLNKPVGVISATRDSELPTVIELLAPDDRPGLHPAGRLDRDTTGLLLLTTDGQWSHRLTSPRRGCRKVYRVNLAEPVGEEMLTALSEGVWLRGEDRATRPAEAEQSGSHELRLTITEGRYHQVKRMMAALGNHVTALHREQVGAIRLDETLRPGDYRPLTDAEIASI